MRKAKQEEKKKKEKTKKNTLEEASNKSAKKETKREKSKASAKKSLGGALFAKMARGGAAELRTNADEVNKLNVFPVPDGDTGDNMRMTIESGIAAIENLNSDNLAEVMRVLSHGMLLGARGNSGVILSQFFAGVADGFKNAKEADPYSLGEALKLGVKKAYETVMTPIEGTILTVAREAVDYSVSKITPQTTIKSFFANLSREMYASLERTPEILPALKSAGVVDSGGAGLFYIMDGFRRVLDGEAIPEELDKSNTRISNNSKSLKLTPDSKMPLPYCTEVMIQLLNSKCKVENFKIDDFREYVSLLGDSVCTVKSDNTVKLHVHTFVPEKVLEYARKSGELVAVKIENMNLQHSEMPTDTKADKSSKNKEDSKQLFTFSENTDGNKKTHSIVTVSCGSGFTDLFYELGADIVIYDKAGKAPSARDFLDAFNETRGEEIFVFPNNSNITLSAKQAAKLYGKERVHVIETKSISEGYAALTAFLESESDTKSVIKSISNTLSNVTDGCVFSAVRNANIDGVNVKKGDTVGIIDRKIVVSSKSDDYVTSEIGNKLLSDKELLTVFYGNGKTKNDAEKLISILKEKNPNKDIYSFFGGQEIYPYVFLAR